MKTIKINTPYIKLDQFLKLVKICQTGGEAKIFVLSEKISVNGETETRRGRKLKDGDVVSIRNVDYQIRQGGGIDGDKTASP